MKPVLLTCLMLFLTALVFAQSLWTGTTSADWNVASNWSPSGVPGVSTDVTIPYVSNGRYPTIASGSAYCSNLVMNSSSALIINSSASLTCGGTVTTSGQIVFYNSGTLIAYGNFTWQSGSTCTTVSGFDPLIIANSNMTFNSGSNVYMMVGTIRFLGSTNTVLTNNSSNTSLNNLEIMKGAGYSLTLASASTQPFTIRGQLYNSSTSTMYNNYTGTVTLIGTLADDSTVAGRGIKWDQGTLLLDGSTHAIMLQNSGSYLQNITFSQTSTASLSYPLTVKGKLRIESGVFSPGTHNVTVGGDWENVVGPTAFNEGTAARVIFNGTAHQHCNYTETFNILEVNKSGGALRVNNSSAVVTCAQYDWTAGAVDVITGTFTANDLVDNGIYGSYFVNPGATINLTNNDGWVDLNGSMTFTNGGTINVFGGTVTSDWSYSGNASLTMSGGVLDFKNQGINIYNSGTYTFTYSFSGNPEIRTAGNFSCNRSTFTPTAGKVVMYGSADATLTMNAGMLNQLNVDKTSSREEESAPAFISDKLTGESRELTRANTVNLATNVEVREWVYIYSGTLNLQSYQFSCSYISIYSTLKMNNASAKLVTESGGILWRGSSVADITLGTLETSGTWQALSGANVVLPVAVVTNLIATSSKNIDSSSATLQFGTLNIGGTATTGGVYTMSGTQNILVAGNLTIRSGNELDLGTRDLTVNGDLNLNGTLEIHATSATVQGKLVTVPTSTLFINSGSLTSNSSTAPRDTYMRGTFTLNSGSLTLTHSSLYVMAGAVNNISGGTINCDGIIALTADTFRPTGGTVVLGALFGGGISPIWVSANNWVHNLTVNASPNGYRLDSDLIIKGNFTLLSGSLDTQSNLGAIHNITISGDWSHQGGVFYPQTGRVIFTGSGHQYVNYTETFNIVEVNKSSGALRVDSSTAVVTIASYDWTLGSVDVLAGTLTLLDLADNGMYGGYYCTPGGTLNITQDTSSRIDLNGTLQITGGAVNIYGGSVYACWPFAAPATLTMNGGSLTYHDQGIYIYNSAHAFTYNITGGNIYTTRGIYCNRPNFNPAGGTFWMTGSYDALVNFSVPSSSLYNLRIDKPGAGTWTVSLSDDLSCRGSVTVAVGKLSLNGKTLNCTVGMYVYGGSYLELGPASVLALGNGALLSVLGAGNLSLLGSADYAPRITRISDGYYNIELLAYSVFAANYAIFEYTGLEGLEFSTHSIINSLDNCTFRYGQTGGRYLTFGAHDIVVNNAHFPMSNGGYNVYKMMGGLGGIVMANATGSFAGSAFEYDPSNVVWWTGSDADLQIIGVDWSRPDSYVCAPITATVTVRNNGSHDVHTGFRVDLYRNSPPPVPGVTGNSLLYLPYLNAGSEATVTFTYVSTDIPGDWTSWLRVDANNLIAESNEANNLWGPITTTWLPLPAVQNLAISRIGPMGIRLDWEYPIWASRFNVYRGTSPDFTPGPSNLFAWPTSPYVNTSGLSQRYFYKVFAERDLP